MKNKIRLTEKEFNLYYYFLRLDKDNREYAIDYLMEKATVKEFLNISRRLEEKNNIKLNVNIEV